MAMLGKKSKPVIGILTGSLVSGNRSTVVSVARNHVESNTQFSKGRKSFDLGGVGLGIVAALEKSSETAANNIALFSRNSTRSHPIPVKNCSKNRGKFDEMEMDSLEEYTIVTCHGPKNSYTKVYNGRKGDDRTPFRIQSNSCNKTSVFHISPVKFGEIPTVPSSDFLSSCDLCSKKLHDKDIYMYRGEKAFCSAECRYRQIVMDERKEKCSSEASIRAGDVASSPYAKDQIFTTGILAI